jgi:hypothetical protein
MATRKINNLTREINSERAITRNTVQDDSRRHGLNDREKINLPIMERTDQYLELFRLSLSRVILFPKGLTEIKDERWEKPPDFLTDAPKITSRTQR